MKLSPQLAQLLNEQIANELSSSYVYLAMAAWFERTPYTGFAQWMFAQSREENAHGSAGPGSGADAGSARGTRG